MKHHVYLKGHHFCSYFFIFIFFHRYVARTYGKPIKRAFCLYQKFHPYIGHRSPKISTPSPTKQGPKLFLASLSLSLFPPFAWRFLLVFWCRIEKKGLKIHFQPGFGEYPGFSGGRIQELWGWLRWHVGPGIAFLLVSTSSLNISIFSWRTSPVLLSKSLPHVAQSVVESVLSNENLGKSYSRAKWRDLTLKSMGHSLVYCGLSVCNRAVTDMP